MTFARATLLAVAGWLAACAPEPAEAAPRLRVAVAANFAGTLEELAADYRAESGVAVDVIAASTGKHLAQIEQGAPFDLFLAADSAAPRRLEDGGFAVPGTSECYAIGVLVLAGLDLDAPDLATALAAPRAGRRLAIANPDTAPYGAAAREALERSGALAAWEGGLVQGESVAQTLQFIESGAAELGFVALAQVLERPRLRWLRVPASLHAPLRQDLALLRDGPAARDFLAFLRRPETRARIAAAGYGLPADADVLE